MNQDSKGLADVGAIAPSRRSLFAGAVGAGLAAAGSAAAQAAPRPLVAQSTAEQPIEILSPSRLEAAAKAAMSPGAYAFVAGGSGDEVTLRANITALQELFVRPRRMTGFATADLGQRLLGLNMAFPFYITPMGVNDIVHTQAELAVARGAASAGALYVVSGGSNQPMELISQAAAGPKWFQIYMNLDPAVNRALLQRAVRAGYKAVVITVDARGTGDSEAYRLLGRPQSPQAGMGNDDPRFGGMGKFFNLKQDFRLSDIAFVREASGGLPVLVKGIMRPEDAVRCMKAGATGVVVSNHGGRQMDGLPPAITALRPIVEAVAGRGPVLFDGGVRRGLDVLRALALGATAVGIGRPVLYGLAVGGGAGVASVLTALRDELATAMLMTGAPNVAALSPDFIQRIPPAPLKG